MKKPVSSQYGWELTISRQREQCICCKGAVDSMYPLFVSLQPQTRSFLCVSCLVELYESEKSTGYKTPIYLLNRYRAEGRIGTDVKQSRAAVERELAKGHAVKL